MSESIARERVEMATARQLAEALGPDVLDAAANGAEHATRGDARYPALAGALISYLESAARGVVKGDEARTRRALAAALYTLDGFRTGDGAR